MFFGCSRSWSNTSPKENHPENSVQGLTEDETDVLKTLFGLLNLVWLKTIIHIKPRENPIYNYICAPFLLLEGDSLKTQS